MGLLAGSYDSMRVVGRSPDRAVTITFGGRGGIEVELARDIMHTHDEATLARQLAAAARVTLAAYQRDQRRAIEDAVERARAAG